MNYYNLFFIVLVTLSCTSNLKKTNEKIMEENRFVRVDDSLSYGTSNILNREIKNPNAIIGDFLSRIWKIYGAPKGVYFEGFAYTFKDTKTGLLFTAYSAGSGPAYGGKYEEREQLLPVLKLFDAMLDSTIPADCEIEFETDFGIMKSGAKNGIPFDIIQEE
jgi:hypothetical protein